MLAYEGRRFFLILVQHIFFRMENNVYLCKQKDDSISNIELSLYSIKKFLIYFRWPVKVGGIFLCIQKIVGVDFCSIKNNVYLCSRNFS
mgnify:CR=1 FL=1